MPSLLNGRTVRRLLFCHLFHFVSRHFSLSCFPGR
jgi:hypothetical protein